MLNVINAEWIKLRSTKALWWTTALILFFSIGFAVLMGFSTGSVLSDPEFAADPAAVGMLDMLKPNTALSGFVSFGLMIVIIQAVLMVTSEYGHGTQKTSVMATPSRWKLPVAKLFVYGAIALIVAFVAAVASIFTMELTFNTQVDDPNLTSMVGFSADHVWDFIGRTLIYTILSVVISIGVAYIVRHTAGAIAALLLWKLVIEMVVGTIPKVGDWLPQWMPFGNMESYVARMDHPDVPWADSLGQTGSMLYFALWCVVIFVVGTVMLSKRDA